MAYFTRKTKTLVGELTLIASDHGLAAILWQTSVWKALLKIPFGQTRTYSQIAEQIGRPAAARAVGAASGKNPISIIAPCHRVVGANCDLTGFAGGLETEKLLLDLERDGRERLGRAHQRSLRQGDYNG